MQNSNKRVRRQLARPSAEPVLHQTSWMSRLTAPALPNGCPNFPSFAPNTPNLIPILRILYSFLFSYAYTIASRALRGVAPFSSAF
ncbi:hypothetical protein JMJ77_0007047 [Colletotrichum scovillei]|uniref:Uncharacterized protein n=1 Tax=Colletotrichum scovillei TaxID=1209932 RepID=A0A9P7RE97_9PEZI|nr:hypothetical protein JMJ77_0007047 [Colletotrichum scovillei]KAG7074048.1 hypothetical protein JMJ76_0010536 [Colletotrichum scovillei]KAG7081124.1 hypothetical protein JMJ78_0003252 [Colletotrichum scovillei]